MAETDSGRRLLPVTRLETMESWRAAVLRGILSVAAIAAPGLTAPVRAHTTVGLCLLGGVTALMTFGFTSGSGIALAGAGVVAAVLLGRSAGLLVIGLAV